MEDQNFEALEDSKGFYPINQISQQDFEEYKSKLKCLDEQIEINGNYNTGVASNLIIAFVKCSDDSKKGRCKSDGEIEKWLENKYLITLENEKKFVQYEFDDKRLQR